MTSVSVVMTVMVLNFHHRGPFHKEIPSWLRWLVLDKLRRMLCMKLPYENMCTPKTNSTIRRLSLKLTIDNLQDELLSDMGLNTVANHHPMTSSSYGGLRNSCNEGPSSRKLSTRIMPSSAPLLPLDQQEPCSCTQRSVLQQEVIKTLLMLISRQELDDECESIANEWRQVAQVIDRLFFWLFLVATVAITVVLLIIIPLIRHAKETNELDAWMYQSMTSKSDATIIQWK